MSKNTATASTAAASSAVKKVTKKADATPVAAAAAAAAPVAAVAETKSKAAKKAAVAETKVDAVAAPVAQAVAAPAAVEEQKSVDQEIAELIAAHQKARDQSSAAIKTLQKLQKRVAKDLKEAGRKRRNRVKKEGDENVTKRETIFSKPILLKDELCALLGKPKGTLMPPREVTTTFSTYVKEKNLKDAANGQIIHPDAALRKAFSLKEGEDLLYKNVQKHLYSLYVLPAKKAQQ